MGYSTQSIPFFTDTIKIMFEETSKAGLCGRVVSIKQFAKGQRVSLEQILETGEYIIRTQGGDFAKGKEGVNNYVQSSK